MHAVWTIERYGRTDSGKSWSSRPFEVVRQEITIEEWRNLTSESEIRFWKAFGTCRVHRSSTEAGRMVDRITRTSADGSRKSVETFELVSDSGE